MAALSGEQIARLNGLDLELAGDGSPARRGIPTVYGLAQTS
jgi:hypothetical protein